ncbi:MAG: UDP-glucose 4-epimerase GalE [Gammaproteobacteria bacterium]|nr:UDP-glucose 4-epimerase GalE [Gammaproteobacteria bacterium]
MKVLVTGGAGYIGSHACLELLEAGYEVVVIDSLVNSSVESLRRVERLTGKSLTFCKADIANRDTLTELFTNHKFVAVMHFAGLKAVGESVQQPLRYYQNNISGSLVLFEVMQKAGVKTLIFSSSATVYGAPESLPIKESAAVGTTNPYGSTKLFIEYMLKDLFVADDSWRIALLRYFNPVGAHVSGQIGEDPNGPPNNLMPYISQVAVGKLNKLNVYGTDYPTQDGTGVRDYIHVVDLVRGHIAALRVLSALEEGEVITANLGTGNGQSVLEMVEAFELASKKPVPYEVAPRREGDIAECWADSSYAADRLDWRAEYGVARMCEDAWRWQKNNPKGY